MPETGAEPSGLRAARSLPWPLLAILAVQIVLAVPLIASREIFSDEGLYGYAGRQMLNHWLHGAPVQDFETYFSGSPALYPPISALANDFGGLVGARTLSLVFILGTTVLLFATASRLFGRATGYFAALLFASLGGTQFLSALATYDTMSLFLLALAAFLAIGLPYNGDSIAAPMRVFVLSPILLALADAVKYAAALWNPVVIVLVAVTPNLAGERSRPPIAYTLRYAAVLAVTLGTCLLIGGPKYWLGIMNTTIARTPEQIGIPTPAGIVLHLAWAWVGAVIVLALVGLVLVLVRPHPRRPALIVIAAALVVGSVLAPLNQARIETDVSLQKHVVFGAWFGCILAGHAVARFASGPLPRMRRPLRLVLLSAVFAISLGTVPPAYATQVPEWHRWQIENPAFITDLRRITQPGGERYLIEGHMDITAYYVGDIGSLQWKEAGGDGYSYTDPSTGESFSGDVAFQLAVANRAFALIVLNNEEPADGVIEAAIKKDGTYRLDGYLPSSTLQSAVKFEVWSVVGTAAAGVAQ